MVKWFNQKEGIEFNEAFFNNIREDPYELLWL